MPTKKPTTTRTKTSKNGGSRKTRTASAKKTVSPSTRRKPSPSKASAAKASAAKAKVSAKKRPNGTGKGRGRAEEKIEVSQDGLQELLYQAYETELGGVKVYETALRCVVNDELREEFEKYLAETKNHVDIARNLLEQCGFDPAIETPGRGVVRHIGESLVGAMEKALKAGEPEKAQMVAAECVLHAETKDHMNWELIGMIAEKCQDEELASLLEAACDEVEEEEDHHYYHTMGWVRELSAQSLGMPAVLPPPEEEKDVDTMAEAAKAKDQRDQML